MCLDPAEDDRLCLRLLRLQLRHQVRQTHREAGLLVGLDGELCQFYLRHSATQTLVIGSTEMNQQIVLLSSLANVTVKQRLNKIDTLLNKFLGINHLRVLFSRKHRHFHDLGRVEDSVTVVHDLLEVGDHRSKLLLND